MNYFDNLIDNLHSLIDFVSEKPKKFYRKFRKGKKIYQTKKMFCYNSLKNMIIPTTMFAIKTLKRRLNNEK